MHRKQDKGLKGGILGQRLKAVRAACRREDFFQILRILHQVFSCRLDLFLVLACVCVCVPSRREEKFWCLRNLSIMRFSRLL